MAHWNYKIRNKKNFDQCFFIKKKKKLTEQCDCFHQNTCIGPCTEEEQSVLLWLYLVQYIVQS